MCLTFVFSPRYNDQAVLENFHAASLFQLLRQRPDLNIFASLPRAKFKEVRKIIIECIIATDPAVHYEYVSKLALKVGVFLVWRL